MDQKTVPSTSLIECGPGLFEPLQRQHRVRSTGVMPNIVRERKEQANLQAVSELSSYGAGLGKEFPTG